MGGVGRFCESIREGVSQSPHPFYNRPAEQGLNPSKKLKYIFLQASRGKPITN